MDTMICGQSVCVCVCVYASVRLCVGGGGDVMTVSSLVILIACGECRAYLRTMPHFSNFKLAQGSARSDLICVLLRGGTINQRARGRLQVLIQVVNCVRANVPVGT